MDQNSINDPRAYPRSYRLRAGKMAFYIFVGFGAFCLAAITIGIAKTATDIPKETGNVLFACGIFYTIFGLSSIIDALRFRLILHFDRIELHTLLYRHRTVLRDELAYIDWMVFERGTVSEWRSKAPLKIERIKPALIRKDNLNRPLIFLDKIKTDQFFDRWLSALRNSGSYGED